MFTIDGQNIDFISLQKLSACESILGSSLPHWHIVFSFIDPFSSRMLDMCVFVRLPVWEALGFKRSSRDPSHSSSGDCQGSETSPGCLGRTRTEASTTVGHLREGTKISTTRRSFLA